MPRLQRRRFIDSEEVRRFPNGEVRLVTIDDMVFGEFVLQPGWRWSEHVRPIAGTTQCEHRHVGCVIRGQLHVTMKDGATMDFVAGDTYEIPPGHDAWVVGNETYHGVEFSGARTFAQSPFELGGGIVATLLFTDIVGSTAKLAEVGDTRWRAMLLEHDAAMRTEIERHRGRELKTTGDGFLAAFDSALRAVRCAQAMVKAARAVGLQIRAACHTGEVEFSQADVFGVAVHAAARVLSLAGDNEVVVSWTTRDLLAGSNIRLESRGRHALKGLEGEREVFRVLAESLP
jgi:class 3 adenylate cyclase